MDGLAEALANDEKRAKLHLGYVALALTADGREDFLTDQISGKECAVVFGSAAG